MQTTPLPAARNTPWSTHPGYDLSRYTVVSDAVNDRDSHHPGCWEHQVNEQWAIAFNAHAEPKPCSLGVTVDPIHCYVQFNGWPAGVFTPYGGQIAAGECANEDAFLEAMDAAISKAKGGAA